MAGTRRGPSHISRGHADSGLADAMDRADPVLALYREKCARSDTEHSSVELNAEQRGQITYDMADMSNNVRTIVLHMNEETARHAGHLDIARELIDGRTGLGPC